MSSSVSAYSRDAVRTVTVYWRSGHGQHTRTYSNVVGCYQTSTSVLCQYLSFLLCIKTTLTYRQATSMDAGRGCKGVHSHPLESKNDDVICCLLNHLLTYASPYPSDSCHRRSCGHTDTCIYWRHQRKCRCSDTAMTHTCRCLSCKDTCYIWLSIFDVNV